MRSRAYPKIRTLTQFTHTRKRAIDIYCLGRGVEMLITDPHVRAVHVLAAINYIISVCGGIRNGVLYFGQSE